MNYTSVTYDTHDGSSTPTNMQQAMGVISLTGNYEGSNPGITGNDFNSSSPIFSWVELGVYYVTPQIFYMNGFVHGGRTNQIPSTYYQTLSVDLTLTSLPTGDTMTFSPNAVIHMDFNLALYDHAVVLKTNSEYV